MEMKRTEFLADGDLNPWRDLTLILEEDHLILEQRAPNFAIAFVVDPVG